MKKNSVEEMCRSLLAKAVCDGLVVVASGAKAPEDLSSGELVGVANCLNNLIFTKNESSEPVEILDDRANYIVRTVTVCVNRSLSPKQAIATTGRTSHGYEHVRDTMPQGSTDVQKLIYFRPRSQTYKDGLLSSAALDDEMLYHGLVSAPRAQIADNAAHPELADTMPNACQWKDANGDPGCMTFYHSLGGRHVYVFRREDVWDARWVFAGVRKETSRT